MSIRVNSFDEKTAKEELKKCPKIVRDYFKLMSDSLDRQKALTNDAIKELKEISKLIKDITI